MRLDAEPPLYERGAAAASITAASIWTAPQGQLAIRPAP